MDAMSWLLNDVRSSGARFEQCILRPPWLVRFADRTPLSMVVMVQGRAWIAADHTAPSPIAVGDVAIVVGEKPYSIADTPERAQSSMRGREPTEDHDRHEILDLSLGVRTCDDPGTSSTVALTGSYPVVGRISTRLLDALPRLVVVRDEGDLCPLMDLTFAEIGKQKPGQQAVLDRLLDLLLLTTLREWFDRPEAQPPAWYRALSDPIAGTALRLIHDTPAKPWTVATLAREVSVSRATLARRFTDLVGEPPMTYLTSWRLSLAADLLQRTDTTIDAIATQVGYLNGYSLSVAFKRVLGTRPGDYRSAHRAA